MSRTETPALLADYELEFTSRITAARQAISSAASAPLPPPATAAAALDAADRDLRDAADLVQSMTLELASVSGGAAMRATVDRCSSVAADARTDLRAARVALASRRGEADRAALFDGATQDIETGFDSTLGDDQRAGLLASTRKLQNGSDRILDSRRNIAQTESIGAAILQDLQNQRATIMRARDNLTGVDEGLRESSNVLTAMNRRALVNKMIIYAVLAIVCLFCLWLIFHKLFWRGKA